MIDKDTSNPKIRSAPTCKLHIISCIIGILNLHNCMVIKFQDNTNDQKEAKMIRNILLLGTALTLLILIVDVSHSIDFRSLADQSSYRCPGGIVAVGDLDRDVREKCGDPLEVGRRQDRGPIWIYSEDQANFMYYLVFLNGKLQRIVGANCSPDNADCFDVR